MLHVSGLFKSYGPRQVLRGIDFDVKSGDYVGLVGPNGCGKSTLLNCLSGVTEPDSGAVESDHLAYVPDDLPLPKYLTGSEYLDLIRRIRPTFDPGDAERLISTLGLDDHLETLIGNYSHGTRKKLQIIEAFSVRPALLLLDEPFSGLDPWTHYYLEGLISDFLAEGGAVLVSTHDLLFAEKEFQTVMIINEGSIVARGRPKTIAMETASSSSLRDAFLKLTKDSP